MPSLLSRIPALALAALVSVSVLAVTAPSVLAQPSRSAVGKAVQDAMTYARTLPDAFGGVWLTDDGAVFAFTHRATDEQIADVLGRIASWVPFTTVRVDWSEAELDTTQDAITEDAMASQERPPVVTGVGVSLQDNAVVVSIRPDLFDVCQAGLRARYGPVRLMFESSPGDVGAQSSPAPSVSPGVLPSVCLPPPSPFPSAGASPSPAAQSPAPASTQSADTFGSWYQVTDDDERAATGLWVGRLDGPAFHIVDEPTVRADGPVDGRVLVWRSAEGQQTVSLVDTADGSTVEILQTDDGGVPILAPDGQTMYWIELRDDGRGDVWRMRLPDGERELILGDRATMYSSLHLSVDGRYLALEGGMDHPADVVVVDTRTGEPWDVRTSGGGVVGFLGRHLVTHSTPVGDEARFPLVAVDPRDGSTRTVARAGIYPAIVPDADGHGVLVWRTSDDEGTSIVVRDSVDGPRRTIHKLSRGERRGPSVAVVRRGYDQGIEIPGYVALFPDGHAFAWPEVAQRYEGRQRSLVSIADGSVIELDAAEAGLPRE